MTANIEQRIHALEQGIALLLEDRGLVQPKVARKGHARKAKPSSSDVVYDVWPVSRKGDDLVKLPADVQKRLLSFLRTEKALSRESASTTGKFVHKALKGLIPGGNLGDARKAVRLAVENGEFAAVCDHASTRKCRVWLDRAYKRT